MMLKRSGYPRLHVLATLSLLGIIILGSTFPSPGMQAYAAPDPPEGVRIGMHDQTGMATFIGANPNTPFKLQSAAVEGLLAEDRSMHYLDYFSDLLGLSSPPKELLVTRQSALQSSGGDSVRYQQTYQGLPILAGELIVNIDSRGGLLSISGEISPDLSLSVKPTVTVGEAGDIALGVVSKGYGLDSDQLTVTEPELWIFDERLLRPSARPPELVWRMEVQSIEGYPINELVLVNAQSGGISLHFSELEFASLPTFRGPSEDQYLPQLEWALSPPLDPTNTWYVSTTGNDTNDCLTTTSPCETINGALGKPGFIAGDLVRVALGTYTSGDPEVVFIDTDVTLSGGWDSSFSAQTGFSVIDGEDARRGMRITSGVVIVEWLVVQNGGGQFSGGGIANSTDLTLDHVIIRDNEAGNNSGGISNSGNLTILYSTLSGNKAFDGGGIKNSGTLTIFNSTFSGNDADASGGGIWDGGTTHIINSTFSGNSADYGGGIYNWQLPMRLYNSTVSDNLGRNNGGGFYGYASITIVNSILAGNTSGTGPDCHRNVFSLGYTIVGDTTDCTYTSGTGDQIADPQVGPLMGAPNNPMYHPLSASSPAINAGNPSGCTDHLGDPITTDQRGELRTGVCDVGAYEYTAPGALDRIVPISGGRQYASPLSPFSDLLQAAVIDNIGSPIVTSHTVTFTAPASGPSGTFDDTSTNVTTSATDSFGVASAEPFIANGLVGSYDVNATVVGVADPAVFALTNFAWFVSPSGNNANDCQTPASSCETINGALSKSGFTAGDTVFVASTTITSTSSEVLLLDEDVTLSGGWDASFTLQDGFTVLDGENTRRGLRVNTGITATLDHFDIQRGVESIGGGVFSLGILTLNNCYIHHNSAGEGGGIRNHTEHLVINNSSISHNTANEGGGIANYGRLTLNNSTVGYNEGGGIQQEQLYLYLNNSTISGNNAANVGGIDHDGGLVTMQNTILAGNTGSKPDCEGTIESSGYSLVGDSTGCTINTGTGDLIDTDPALGSLIGQPAYFNLLPTSPAIDVGDPAGCEDHHGNPLDADQRGVSRIGRCDIGAYEYTTSGTAAVIYAHGGMNQRTAPLRAFPLPLQAEVLDAVGSPVEGVTVTFTAPPSGMSGTFIDSGTNITSAMTNGSGVATSSIFTANELVGSYDVVATASGIPSQGNIPLSNFGWYITTGGNDGNDCQTPTTSCATIDGVVVKSGFAEDDMVLVASGIYTGTGSDVWLLEDSLRILGGWDPTFTTRAGDTIIDGEDARRGVMIQNGVTVLMERINIQNGSAQSPWFIGGGIRVVDSDLTIRDCTVTSSYAYQTGGIEANATTLIENCTISNNSNGGIRNVGTMTIRNSTISGNTNINSSGGISNDGAGVLIIEGSTIYGNNSGDDGGGVFNNGSSVTIINSTISGNTAFDRGGGIYSPGTSNLTLKNSTITENNGGTGGGTYGVILLGLENSIISGNTASSSAPDCFQGSGSSEYTLIGDTENCNFIMGTGDLYDNSAILGGLQDNGGQTLTHLPYAGSPSIDAGNPATPGSGGSACLDTDQRGTTRPEGSVCDMGAVEGSEYSLLLTLTALNRLSLPGRLLCTDSEPSCTAGSDPHADAAHQHAADTYAFYSTYHGRNSLDDAGMPIISSVHYDSGFGNAYWDGDQVVYGDAYGFPLADDIVAHELTHGVTDYTSNLFFYYQSGAINSSFSDLWGEFVDQTNGSGDDSPAVKWLIGEDITGMGVIRDMEDPPVYGDPDKMTSPNYYTGSADLGVFGDSGGVHTNGGVNNKAVFLMTDGGSFNGYNVSALGLDKVAAIYYEVQTSLLTSGSDYGDLYNTLYQGCLNLVGGVEGITTGNCDEVRDASDAVEMNLQPVPGYNPEAEICSTGKVPSDSFFDDFEAGAGNWTFEALTGTSSWKLATGYATSGTKLLWGDDTATLSDSVSAMNAGIDLPFGSQHYLHFTHAFGFEDPDFDGAFLEYSTNGGGSWTDAGSLFDSGLDYTGNIFDPGPVPGANPNRGHVAFIADSHGYVSTRYDLSSLAGENVRFRWRVSTDVSYYDWGWFVDDVRIYSCVEPTTYQLYLPLIMR